MAVQKQTADNIKALKGLDPVRKRPGMYIGSTDARGVFQIVKEIVDNSIDEALANRNDTILVDISKYGKKDFILVADKGGGIPVEKSVEFDGKSVLTGIFTTLHAGGKFDSKAYSISGGLHGVGSACTNACSSLFEVWTCRNNKWYYQKFSEGKAISKVEKQKPPIKWDCGTIIRFKPDIKIFENSRLAPKMIEDWLKEIQFLVPGVKFIFINMDGEKSKFSSKDGLKGMVQHIAETNKWVPMHPKPFAVQTKQLDVSLLWTGGDEYLASFVNVIKTSEHGTHVNGLKKAIGDAIIQVAKNGKDITRDDLMSGLVATVHIKLKEPIFEGQTKSKLGNKEASKIVYDEVYKPLLIFLESNKKLIKALITRAMMMKKARDKFNKELASIKKVREVINSKGLPAKLLDSKGCPPHKRELFIVEGDSAKGTLEDARNPDYQEVLPIKGKFNNVAKDKKQAALLNADVANIIAAIGSDILDKCDPKKARVGNIFIAMDADADGKHISSLALTLLMVYMAPLINAGKVHLVMPPLFAATTPKGKVFGDTLREVQAKAGKNAIISRLKGLGEMDAEDMESLMSPKTRKVVTVNPFDKTAMKAVLAIMGEDISKRKELLNMRG